MKSQVRYSVEDTGQHRMVFGHITSVTTLYLSQSALNLGGVSKSCSLFYKFLIRIDQHSIFEIFKVTRLIWMK